MHYVFIYNPSATDNGTSTYGQNLVDALKKHAKFDFTIIDKDYSASISKIPKDSVVHVHSSEGLVRLAMRNDFTLILGPHINWRRIRNDDEIFKYRKVKAVISLRQTNTVPPVWSSLAQWLPPCVDEAYFTPKDAEKTIDVLTVDRAQSYPMYHQNIMMLLDSFKRLKLRHYHLTKPYTKSVLRKTLNSTKVLVFPSPREHTTSIGHLLLEANAMNVPFIGLRSCILNRPEEFHSCRGLAVDGPEVIVDRAGEMVKSYNTYKPRNWVVERFSLASICQRLQKICDR